MLAATGREEAVKYLTDTTNEVYFSHVRARSIMSSRKLASECISVGTSRFLDMCSISSSKMFYTLIGTLIYWLFLSNSWDKTLVVHLGLFGKSNVFALR